MINKSTFYSHYADIYELSEELETEVVISVIQTIDHSGLLFENPEAFTRALLWPISLRTA